MAYFVFKMFPGKKLEALDSFEKFIDAKKYARDLRKDLPEDANYNIKMIFAKSELEAEVLLKEEREPRPVGDD